MTLCRRGTLDSVEGIKPKSIRKGGLSESTEYTTHETLLGRDPIEFSTCCPLVPIRSHRDLWWR